MSGGPLRHGAETKGRSDAPPGTLHRHGHTRLLKGSWAVARAMVEADDFPILWRAEEHAKYTSNIENFVSEPRTSRAPRPFVQFNWACWKENLMPSKTIRRAYEPRLKSSCEYWAMNGCSFGLAMIISRGGLSNISHSRLLSLSSIARTSSASSSSFPSKNTSVENPRRGHRG